MRILHVIATIAARDGGPSKACFEMARAVARRGHEVAIYTTNMDGPGVLDVPVGDPVERDGVTLRHFPVTAPRFWGTSPAMARALEADIASFDVVHLHSLYMFHDRVVGRVCKATGTPYIMRPHGTLDPYLYKRRRFRKLLMELWFQNAVTRGAAKIHFTTEEEMQLAAPYVFGRPGVVIPNGLDFSEYADLPPRGTFRAQHPQIGDRPVVLFFGRLNFKKGLDILTRAFADMAEDAPDAHLVIAGPDGGMRAKTEAWIDEYGLRDRTTFTGMVTGPDKLDLLTDADLFVLPSYSENFGISVIEASACGLPVAISDKVNLWHEIDTADAGWVTPAEPGPFREAMLAALSDLDAAREKGQRGRALVADTFDWSRIGEALEE
ncbi:MAG: glycosyltransferase, partial [Alphaproteobacteria bacterium]|nr:glycosyltransferase [Alphaproteobacteria bacterium]